MRTYARGLCLGLALAAQPVTVRAQEMLCGDRDGIVTVLADQYGEARKAIGVTGAGAVMELFTSEDGETWTLLLTVPEGPTCMIAAGDFWEPIPTLVGRET